MNLLFGIIYPILCIFIPSIIYQVIIIKYKKTTEKTNKKHLIWVYIFLIYLCLCFEAVGIGSIWDIGRYDGIIRPGEINFIPFSSDSIEEILI